VSPKVERGPTVTVAGWQITVRNGLVYLAELEQQRDPGLTVPQATALAVALRAASRRAIRQTRRTA
jgi:hypothetical protein